MVASLTFAKDYEENFRKADNTSTVSPTGRRSEALHLEIWQLADGDKGTDSIETKQAKRKAAEALEEEHKASSRPLWGWRTKERRSQPLYLILCFGASKVSIRSLTSARLALPWMLLKL